MRWQIKHDILSRFIELGEDPSNNFTNKSLRDVVLNFVIAGRDTTAATLSWAIYMVMTHSHVADKLYSELKSFEEERAKEERISLLQHHPTTDLQSFERRVMQFAQLLNYDSLARLHYLHAMITETLRLYPAVPQVSNKYNLLNYKFERCGVRFDVYKVSLLVWGIRTQREFWRMMFYQMEQR